MADHPEPTDEQVRASVKDAIRKLTEPAADAPKDGVGPEGRDHPDDPAQPPPKFNDA